MIKTILCATFCLFFFGVPAHSASWWNNYAQCGQANGVPTDVAPTSGRCSTGKASAVTGTGPWSWSCYTRLSTAFCAAPFASTPINGACGSASGVAVTTAPTTGLCSAGTATTVTGSGPWAWTCNGSNGGTNASCSAPIVASTPVNGVCGSANGVAVTTAPTAGLCTAGTATAVSGTGPWTWGCSGSNSGASASCSAPVAASNRLNLGINIGQINYYNNQFLYADVSNVFAGNNGPWDTANGSAAAPLDSTGAPTVAAYTYITASYPAVPMTLSWSGTGSVLPDPACKVGALTTSGGVNTQTVTCPQVATGSNPAAAPVFYQFRATPPVTNIHLTLPASASSGMFTSDFINRLASFSTIRFMDLLNTNFGMDGVSINPVQNWSQRTWPSSGSRYQPQGVAYEDIIALANQTGKAIWINIPVLATDDYVCRLARLLRYGEPGDKSNSACSTSAAGSGTETPLNSNVTIYIEQANEVWNWIFPATAQLYCWANGGPASGNSCPVGTTPTSTMGKAALVTAPWTGGFSGDPNGKATAYGMFLTKRNHDIFTQVFGSQAGQIKTVYNAQSGNTGYYVPYLQFMTTNYGAVNGYISVLAVAPYLSLSNGNDISSVGTIFSDLNAVLADTSANGMGAEFSGDLATAQQFSMSLAAYEGGQDLSGNNTTVCAAQTDPSMNTLYKTYFNLWAQKVGSSTLFNHYAFAGTCTSVGQWGALVNQADQCSQKWAALMSLTGGPACTP
jgi:hypothetical protein